MDLGGRDFMCYHFNPSKYVGYSEALNANASTVSKELVTNQSIERESLFSDTFEPSLQIKNKTNTEIRSPTHKLTDPVTILNFIQVSPTHFCS